MSEGGPLERPVEAYLPGLRPIFEQHGVRLAFLYGSQARGDAGPLSDVDVGVLFAPGAEDRSRWGREAAVLLDLAPVFGRDDTYVVDLDTVPPLLRHFVWREGRLLYAADEAARVEFGVRALQEYEDTAPLRRVQQAHLLTRIGRGELGCYPKGRPSMTDAEVIVNRLGYINEFLAELEPLRALTRPEFHASPVNCPAAERLLERVIQISLNIGSYLLAADFAQRPHRYRDIFPLLGRVGVLEPGLVAQMADLAGLRNLLVHLYAPADPDRVYDHAQRDPDLIRPFAQQIVAYLRRSGALKDRGER